MLFAEQPTVGRGAEFGVEAGGEQGRDRGHADVSGRGQGQLGQTAPGERTGGGQCEQVGSGAEVSTRQLNLLHIPLS